MMRETGGLNSPPYPIAPGWDGLWGRGWAGDWEWPVPQDWAQSEETHMPTYEYECGACGHLFERFQSITAKPIRKCPLCGKSKAKRLIGAGAAILFRGSGFYETDYRSSEYRSKAKAESGKASDKSSKSDSTSSSDSSGSKSSKTSSKGSSDAKD